MAAGEELLALCQDPVGLGEPGRGAPAVDLEGPRAGDVVGEVPAALDRNEVAAGMDDYLTKPILRDELNRKIREIPAQAASEKNDSADVGDLIRGL